jgi:hypothetical protein
MKKKPVTSAVNGNIDDIMDLAASLNALHRQITDAYTPIVENLIQSRSRDSQQIEHTLDHLLGCACIPEGLALFKSLCRYYYTLNPAASGDYVGIFRDMWDSENAEEAKA